MKIGTIKSVNTDRMTVSVSFRDGSYDDNVGIPSPFLDPRSGGGMVVIPTAGSLCVCMDIDGSTYIVMFIPPMNSDSHDSLPNFEGGRNSNITRWSEGDFAFVSPKNKNSFFKVTSDGLIALWSSPICNIVMYPETSNLVSITTDNVKWEMGKSVFEAMSDRTNDSGKIKFIYKTPSGIESGSISIDILKDGMEVSVNLSEKINVKLGKDGSVDFKASKAISISSDSNIIMQGGALTIKP